MSDLIVDPGRMPLTCLYICQQKEEALSFILSTALSQRLLRINDILQAVNYPES